MPHQRGAGAEWYIENVLEELDYPTEFFYSQASQELYYVTNTTLPPASGDVFEVPQLKTLVSVIGTQAAPVLNVTFTGITFQGSAYTYAFLCSIAQFALADSGNSRPDMFRADCLQVNTDEGYQVPQHKPHNTLAGLTV